MKTDDIIDFCLKAIGEKSTTSPVRLSRADCLIYINHAYQNIMGPLLNLMTTATTLTVTAGVATLPSDFLAPVRVTDGSLDDGTLLTQIFDINDKVDDGDEMQQFLIPNETQIWFFGKTPDSTVYLYYLQKPTALTDLSSSSPTSLKEKFHTSFSTYINMIIAERRRQLNNMLAFEAKWLDILDDIRREHSSGRRDFEPMVVKEVWG